MPHAPEMSLDEYKDSLLPAREGRLFQWQVLGAHRWETCVGFHCMGSCHKWTTTPFTLQFLLRTLFVRTNETWIRCVLHLTTSQQIPTSFSLVFPPAVDILPLCLDSVYWSFWFLFVFPGVGCFVFFFGLLVLYCALMTHAEVGLWTLLW